MSLLAEEYIILALTVFVIILNVSKKVRRLASLAPQDQQNIGQLSVPTT
jgi:hypothetical protein